MVTTPYEAFVVKSFDQYCRFGSYRKVAFVNSPLRATLYARQADAEYRTTQGHYDSQGNHFAADQFHIVLIKMTNFTEERLTPSD